MPATNDPTVEWDGVVDYNANATSLVLAPGNRAELLLKAPDAPGTYKLVQLSHKMQQFLNAESKVSAVIVVAGAPKRRVDALQAMDGQDRVPLPYPAARGYRDDGQSID